MPRFAKQDSETKEEYFFKLIWSKNCIIDLLQLLYNMNAQPLKHLTNHLIWTLDENLHGPPVISRHMTEEPLTRRSTRNELFRHQFNPLNHHWLKANDNI